MESGKSASVCIPFTPSYNMNGNMNGNINGNMNGNININRNFNNGLFTPNYPGGDLGSLPENAFSYNYGGDKNYSDKKKSKKSREEVDQTLFMINIDNIIYGRDKRTTIMIRHIPNKYSTLSLLEEINSYFKGKYDFFYLPMDFEVK